MNKVEYLVEVETRRNPDDSEWRSYGECVLPAEIDFYNQGHQWDKARVKVKDTRDS